MKMQPSRCTRPMYSMKYRSSKPFVTGRSAEVRPSSHRAAKLLLSAAALFGGTSCSLVNGVGSPVYTVHNQVQDGAFPLNPYALGSTILAWPVDLVLIPFRFIGLVPLKEWKTKTPSADAKPVSK